MVGEEAIYFEVDLGIRRLDFRFPQLLAELSETLTSRALGFQLLIEFFDCDRNLLENCRSGSE